MEPVAKMISDKLTALRQAKLAGVPAPVGVYLDTIIVSVVGIGAVYAEQAVTKLLASATAAAK